MYHRPAPECTPRARIEVVSLDQKEFQGTSLRGAQLRAGKVFKDARCALSLGADTRGFIMNAPVHGAVSSHLRVSIGQVKNAAGNFNSQRLIGVQRIEPHTRYA